MMYVVAYKAQILSRYLSAEIADSLKNLILKKHMGLLFLGGFDYLLTDFIGKSYQNCLKKSRHVTRSAFGWFFEFLIEANLLILNEYLKTISHKDHYVK